MKSGVSSIGLIKIDIQTVQFRLPEREYLLFQEKASKRGIDLIHYLQILIKNDLSQCDSIGNVELSSKFESYRTIAFQVDENRANRIKLRCRELHLCISDYLRLLIRSAIK